MTDQAAEGTYLAAEASADATNQVLDALNRMRIDPATLARVPWDSLHDIVGYIWPETLWVVAASSGNGKSSTLMQLVDVWARDGRKVYVLPLEQPARIMRLIWASLANNLNPQHVLENEYSALPDRARTAIAGHLKWQTDPTGGGQLVQFSSEQFVGENQVGDAFLRAHAFGASVIVLDHIHRLDMGSGNTWGALVRICQLLKEGAKQFRIPVVAAAQLQRDKEGDILAPFLPPKPTAIQGGEVIRQEADVVFGLYRPLMDTATLEDMRAMRTGKTKIRPFLEPNTIGIHVLKHRVRGAALGEIVKLAFQHGRIVCQQTENRRKLEERFDL